VSQPERNLLKIVLTDPRYRRDADAYDQLVSNMLAEFRLDFGHCAGDPAFERLIAELDESVPEFARLWSHVELSSTPRATVVQHDELGQLYFDRVTYVPEHHTAVRVLMFIPGEPNTARVIAALERPIDEAPAPWRPPNFLSAASCTLAAGALCVPSSLGI
jgi:hypothetical protein